MEDFYFDGRSIHKSGGEYIGKIEPNAICDATGGELIWIKENSVCNRYGTALATVEKGNILSTSGGELSSLGNARRYFGNSNDTEDIYVAAAWMCFVKGIR